MTTSPRRWFARLGIAALLVYLLNVFAMNYTSSAHTADLRCGTAPGTLTITNDFSTPATYHFLNAANAVSTAEVGVAPSSTNPVSITIGYPVMATHYFVTWPDGFRQPAQGYTALPSSCRPTTPTEATTTTTIDCVALDASGAPPSAHCPTTTTVRAATTTTGANPGTSLQPTVPPSVSGSVESATTTTTTVTATEQSVSNTLPRTGARQDVVTAWVLHYWYVVVGFVLFGVVLVIAGRKPERV